MKNVLFPFLLLFIVTFSYASQPIVIKNTIEWSEPSEYQVSVTDFAFQHSFKNAHYTDVHPTLPIYTEKISVPGYGKLQASLVDAEYEEITNTAGLDDNFIFSAIDIHAEIHISKKKAIGGISFIPIRKNTFTGSYERLVSFEIQVEFTPISLSTAKAPPTNNSELRHGDIYKLAIGETGVYKLGYDYLKNILGIDVDNIDPKKIKIFGNGGGMLPEPNSTPRIDDLMENAILVQGENDGRFNTNDYILFYAQGASIWDFSYTGNYSRTTNVYADSNFYFLRILGNDTNGKRIQPQASIGSTTYTTNEFDGLAHYEEDVQNLLDYSSSAHGSGKQGVGNSFKVNTSQDFSFNFPNLVNNKPIAVLE